MHPTALGVVSVIVALCVAATSAHGRVPWPQPAAGSSASGAPEVIFTFDDGPGLPTTEKVLDILAVHNIKAIFFIVARHFQGNRGTKYQDLTARIVRDGHIIGNHSMSHAKFCGLDDASLDIEIAGARQLLERAARLPVPWCRVPYGSRCANIEAALIRNGTEHFHWDIDPQEWQGRSAKTTAALVIRKLAHLEGRAVVLMHDTKPATLQALPVIIDWIYAENAKRKQLGRREIRILSAPDLAAERAAATIEWMTRATATARSWAAQALTTNIP